MARKKVNKTWGGSH